MNFITLRYLQTIYVNTIGKIFEKWALAMRAKVAQVTKWIDLFIYLTHVYWLLHTCLYCVTSFTSPVAYNPYNSFWSGHCWSSHKWWWYGSLRKLTCPGQKARMWWRWVLNPGLSDPELRYMASVSVFMYVDHFAVKLYIVTLCCPFPAGMYRLSFLEPVRS